MDTQWKLQENLLTELQRQATKIYPRECCGVLLGHRDSFCVQEICAAQNVIRNRRGEKHFQIDPLELFRIERRADEKGMDVVGFYHSHPDHPAEVSEEDERDMIPGLIYLIIAVREDSCQDIRLFGKRKLDEGAFELHTDY